MLLTQAVRDFSNLESLATHMQLELQMGEYFHAAKLGLFLRIAAAKSLAWQFYALPVGTLEIGLKISLKLIQRCFKGLFTAIKIVFLVACVWATLPIVTFLAILIPELVFNKFLLHRFIQKQANRIQLEMPMRTFSSGEGENAKIVKIVAKYLQQSRLLLIDPRQSWNLNTNDQLTEDDVIGGDAWYPLCRCAVVLMLPAMSSEKGFFAEQLAHISMKVSALMRQKNYQELNQVLLTELVLWDRGERILNKTSNEKITAISLLINGFVYDTELRKTFKEAAILAFRSR